MGLRGMESPTVLRIRSPQGPGQRTCAARWKGLNLLEKNWGGGNHHGLCCVAFCDPTLANSLSLHPNSTFAATSLQTIKICALLLLHSLWFICNSFSPFPECQLSTLVTVKPSLITAPSFTLVSFGDFQADSNDKTLVMMLLPPTLGLPSKPCLP